MNFRTTNIADLWVTYKWGMFLGHLPISFGKFLTSSDPEVNGLIVLEQMFKFDDLVVLILMLQHD